jgi:hypothetical protein
LECLGIDGRIILKWILEEKVVMIWIGWSVDYSCAHGNAFLGYITAGKFLTSWGTISFSRRTLVHGSSYVDLFEFIFLLKSWSYESCCNGTESCFMKFRCKSHSHCFSIYTSWRSGVTLTVSQEYGVTLKESYS